MLVDLLAAHSRVQTRAEWIAAQDADDEGFIGGGERLRRPLHETRKVVTKHGLDLILGRRIRAAGAPHEHGQPQRAAKHRLQSRPQYRHAPFPWTLRLISTRVGSGTPYSG